MKVKNLEEERDNVLKEFGNWLHPSVPIRLIKKTSIKFLNDFQSIWGAFQGARYEGKKKSEKKEKERKNYERDKK